MALDVPELEQAVSLARRLQHHVGLFKIGLELYSAHGAAAVTSIAEYRPVFLDLKLHDIPTTVERAALRLARVGVSMLTVHALGGPQMITAAVRGMGRGERGTGRPVAEVLAVTILTSLGDDQLRALGLPPAQDAVTRLARLAVDAGADGLVCAPHDLGRVRDAVGPEPTLVTPGIRLDDQSSHDHARFSSPLLALQGGADYLVVGRPITRAADPATAAATMLAATGPLEAP